MKKQIDGQLNLFDYISEEERNTYNDTDNTKSKKEDKTNKIIKDYGKSKEISFDNESLILLYKECNDCWCSTCRHNGKGKAIPRDFAGEKKPCPSCDFCIKQKKAEICEIGSYENGCKLRAEEEGIM